LLQIVCSQLETQPCIRLEANNSDHAPLKPK
jgi:hypothetical protein